MTIFDTSEKVDVIACQNFRYDNYSGYQYYLECVNVEGKVGLVSVEDLENCGFHARVVLEPVYDEIRVRKISSSKANYDRYTVYGDGKQVGMFTMVLNEWIPLRNHQDL